MSENRGRCSLVRFIAAPGSSRLQQEFGNCWQLRKTKKAATSPKNSVYDQASRLTGLTYKMGTSTIGTLTYGYDANGRRTNVGGSMARTNLPAPFTSATYDNANRQMTMGSRGMAYDQGKASGLAFVQSAQVGGSLARTALPDPVSSAIYDLANRILIFDGQGKGVKSCIHAGRQSLRRRRVRQDARLQDLTLIP